MSSLTAILGEVANVVRGVSGIVLAPTYPPDTVSEDFDLPAGFIYPSIGGLMPDTHDNKIARSETLIIQLGLKRRGVDAETVASAAMSIHEPLGTSLLRAWMTNQFNGTVPFLGLSGPSNAMPFRWEYAGFDWGGLEVLGFQYELDLTYREEIPA